MTVKQNLAGTMQQSFEIGKTDTVGVQTNSGALQGKDNGGSYSDIALLGGRTGGQILNGGIASGDDLTLASTSHGTKGNIITTDGVTITIPNNQNQVGLAVIQNDTTNNPVAMTIANAGSGNSLVVDTTALIVTGAGNVTMAGSLDVTGTVNAGIFDTNVAAAGVTLAGTSLVADGTDVTIDIIITPKGNAGIILPNAAGAPSVTTSKLYQTGGELFFDGIPLETRAFADLIDVTATYSNAYALTRVNSTPNGMEETTTLLTEPAANQFQIARGTSAALFQGNLTVEAASLVNQDLTSDASPTFAGITMSTGATDTYIIQGNGSGVMSWTDPATIISSFNGSLGIYDNYIHTETGSNNLGDPVEQDGILTKFIINVTTAFDGSSPTIEIGDAGDADRFVVTGDVDLETVGVYIVDLFYRYGAQTQVTTTITASGASQGTCDVLGTWNGS